MCYWVSKPRYLHLIVRWRSNAPAVQSVGWTSFGYSSIFQRPISAWPTSRGIDSRSLLRLLSAAGIGHRRPQDAVVHAREGSPDGPETSGSPAPPACCQALQDHYVWHRGRRRTPGRYVWPEASEAKTASDKWPASCAASSQGISYLWNWRCDVHSQPECWGHYWSASFSQVIVVDFNYYVTDSFFYLELVFAQKLNNAKKNICRLIDVCIRANVTECFTL